MSNSRPGNQPSSVGHRHELGDVRSDPESPQESFTIDGGLLRERTVVLVGGGSGLGFQVARLSISLGAHVILGGRTPERLVRACDELGEYSSWARVDTSDHASLTDFFGDIDQVDHLFTTAADYRTGPIRQLSNKHAESAMTEKFWGQYYAVKYALPRFSPEGSIVLMAGADGVRPSGPAPAYVACNAAVEGLGRGLAVELAPIRVNVLSPGAMDGNFWATRKSQQERDRAFGWYRESNLVKRVGTEAEVAAAVVFLFTNRYTTGSALYTDGGYTLR